MSEYVFLRCAYDSGRNRILIDFLKEGSVAFWLKDDLNFVWTVHSIPHFSIRCVIRIHLMHNVFVERITTVSHIFVNLVFSTLTFGGLLDIGGTYRG